MKAKDLAALLLQNPEDEVFFEYLSGSDDHYYYNAMSVSGVERTPDGVFMAYDYIKDRTYEVRQPSQKPKVNSARIKLNDEENPWFEVSDHWSDSNDLESGYFWVGLIDNKYYKTWWYGECGAAFSLEEDPEEDMGDYDFHYTPQDVVYVEVLKSLQPDTWEETWERMTFEEAYEYFSAIHHNPN